MLSDVLQPGIFYFVPKQLSRARQRMTACNLSVRECVFGVNMMQLFII